MCVLLYIGRLVIMASAIFAAGFWLGRGSAQLDSFSFGRLDG